MKTLKYIYVIDEQINESVGQIDFIPCREERLILNNKEYEVRCIVHIPEQNGILVMVDIAQSYYSNKIKGIKW